MPSEAIESGMRYGNLQKKLSRMVSWTVALAFILVWGMVGAYLGSSSQSRIIDTEKQMLGIMARQLNYVQQSVSSMARQIVVDSRVQEALLEKPKTVFRDIVKRDNMKRLLMTYANMSPLAQSIMIYTGNEVYSTNRTLGISDIKDEAWYVDFVSRGAQNGYTRRHMELTEQGTGATEVVSFVLTFREINSANRILGQLIMSLNYQRFLADIELNMNYLTGWCIFDRFGREVARQGTVSLSFEDIGTKRQISLPGGDIALINDEMQDGWIILSQVSGRAMRGNRFTLLAIALAICVTLLAGLLLALKRSILRSTAPIKDLHDAAIQIGKGDFDIRVKVDTDDELSDLAETMNHMTMDLRNLMNETVRYERLTRDMEINRLMLQIKPHFIYNTLNSIVYMASESGNAQIERFTKAFITLLQNTLSVQSDSVFIPLRREIDNIKNYMVLQQYRYPGKIDLSVSCPEELLDCAIPNVFLQPLVENSIIHGLVPKEGFGRLSIEVERRGGDLVIRVADDGVGMDEEQIRKLFQSTTDMPGIMHTVGFNNVCQRIKHIYGENYGIQVSSVPDEGTLLTIVIPCVIEPAGDELQ